MKNFGPEYRYDLIVLIYDQKYVVGGANFLVMPFPVDRMLEIYENLYYLTLHI